VVDGDREKGDTNISIVTVATHIYGGGGVALTEEVNAPAEIFDEDEQAGRHTEL